MSKVFVEPDYILLFSIEYVRENPDYSKLVSYINAIDTAKLDISIDYMGNLPLSGIIKLSMIKELFKIYMNKIGKEYPKDNLSEYMSEICIEAVREDGTTLEYVKNQTENICLEAVRQDGYALQYVKEQTEEICLEAVRQDGYALKYVREQTKEICLEAVRDRGHALKYVKDQTEEICLEAVIQDKHSLHMINIDIDPQKLYLAMHSNN